MDTLSGQVSANTSNISQNANSITTTVQRLDGHDGDISQINQRADNISSTVSSLETDLNGKNI